MTRHRRHPISFDPFYPNLPFSLPCQAACHDSLRLPSSSMRRRRGYQTPAKPPRSQFRDCEDWKRLRKGAWDNPWESVSLRDLVGPKLYDQIMQWNDSGALEALRIAEERKRAVMRRVPCWVPKLRDDLYVAKVDWESPESIEACNLPQSAAHAYQEEDVKENGQVSQGWVNHENLSPSGWPVKPSGWDPSEKDEPKSGWETEGWHILIPTRTVWKSETATRAEWEKPHNHQLHLIMERC